MKLYFFVFEMSTKYKEEQPYFFFKENVVIMMVVIGKRIDFFSFVKQDEKKNTRIIKQ